MAIRHARRLSWSYQRFPLGTQLRSLLVHQNDKVVYCKNGIGDLKHRFGFHTSGMHCHLGSKQPPPYSKITKCMPISIKMFDRTLPKDQMLKISEN